MSEMSQPVEYPPEASQGGDTHRARKKMLRQMGSRRAQNSTAMVCKRLWRGMERGAKLQRNRVSFRRTAWVSCLVNEQNNRPTCAFTGGATRRRQMATHRMSNAPPAFSLEAKPASPLVTLPFR